MEITTCLKRKKRFTFLFTLILTLSFLAPGSANGKNLFDLMIQPRGIAPEWSFINSFQFSLKQIRDFEDRFSVPIKDIHQQYFSLEGVIVEVNYYETRSETSAASLYQQISRVKQRNSFLAKIDRVVLDFTSPDYTRAVALSKKIPDIPSIFYQRILHSDLPENWRILGEVVQPSQGVKDYKKKFLARIDAIVHQLLLVDGTKVQVNIIQSPNTYERARLADYLKSKTSKRNLVIEHKNITMELVSSSLGRSFAVADFFKKIR